MIQRLEERRSWWLVGLLLFSDFDWLADLSFSAARNPMKVWMGV